MRRSYDRHAIGRLLKDAAARGGSNRTAALGPRRGMIQSEGGGRASTVWIRGPATCRKLATVMSKLPEAAPERAGKLAACPENQSDTIDVRMLRDGAKGRAMRREEMPRGKLRYVKGPRGMNWLLLESAASASIACAKMATEADSEC